MENLKKVLALVVELANVGDTVGRSKNWTALTGILDEVMALPSVDWSLVAVEAKNPDLPELVLFIKEKLDLEDDSLEKKVEATVMAVGAIASSVLLWASVQEQD